MTSGSSDPDQRLQKLAAINTLMAEMIAAKDPGELLFLFSNYLTSVLPIDLVAVMDVSSRVPQVKALSGQESAPEGGAFTEWLGDLSGALHIQATGSKDDNGTAALMSKAPAWLPRHVIAADNAPSGLQVLCFSAKPFAEKDHQLVTRLTETLGQLFDERTSAKGFKKLARTLPRWRLAAAALVAAVLLFPIRQTVSAPAEIVSIDPYFIRAEIDGTIERLLVGPNAQVREGQAIARLDDRELKADLEIANREVALAKAEYDQLLRQALTDPKSRSELSVRQLTVDLQLAKQTQVQDRLARTVVQSPGDGVLIIDAETEILGKAVKAGESFGRIADPERVQVEILLPITDAIDLEMGSDVLVFLNTDPNRSYPATLSFASFQAAPSREGFSVFRMEAELVENVSLPRLGLRGTAVLYGKRQPLILQVSRKPLAGLRQWLGI